MGPIALSVTPPRGTAEFDYSELLPDFRVVKMWENAGLRTEALRCVLQAAHRGCQ